MRIIPLLILVRLDDTLAPSGRVDAGEDLDTTPHAVRTESARAALAFELRGVPGATLVVGEAARYRHGGARTKLRLKAERPLRDGLKVAFHLHRGDGRTQALDPGVLPSILIDPVEPGEVVGLGIELMLPYSEGPPEPSEITLTITGA